MSIIRKSHHNLLPTDGTETVYLPCWHPSYGSNPATYISKDRNAYSFTRTGGVWGYQGWTADGNDKLASVLTNIAPAGAFTIIVWFKGQPTNEDALVSFSNTTGFFLSLESNTLIELRCNGAANYRRWAPTIGANWRHLVITLPGSAATSINTATATLDGTLLSASATASADVQNARSLIKIGEGDTGDRPATQTFGEVWIYSRVLSTSEILRNYQNTRWRYVS